MSTSWRKSTYSGPNGGNCVEIRRAEGRVQVRDTADRDGFMLSVAPAAWRSFTAAVEQAA